MRHCLNTEKNLAVNIVKGEINFYKTAEIVAMNKGGVNFHDFLIMTLVRIGSIDNGLVKAIKEQFTQLDCDKSGGISLAEVHAAQASVALSLPLS